MDNKKFAPTTVNEYFSWLEQTVDPKTELYRTAHEYMEGERQRFACQEKTEQPFLSVITRTQGKRPDMLRETLLCLTAQSNTDFELLLMGHNLSQEQDSMVKEIIAEMPEWMRAKTRLVPVTGGTRTTPLNEGFRQAKGKYIVILDDDDVAFGDWVEEFYRLSQENDGKVLHTYTVMQEWETVGQNIPRAIGAPSEIYCKDFNFFEELSINSCPPGALAFPAYAFKELGIHFDETMTTTEDWDYLMRCAFLTGVASSNKVTFLYRQWRNAESSATVHSRKEWDDNYARIVGNFVRTPIVMPIGSLSGIADRYVRKYSGNVSNDQEMFFDDGGGYSASKMLKYLGASKDEPGSLFKMKTPKKVVAVRYDPEKKGGICLKDLAIHITCEDDSVVTFTQENVKCNGVKYGDRLLFMKSDPQIYLKLPKPLCIKQVRVECNVNESFSDDEVEAYLCKNAWKSTIVYRVARKGYHFLRKVKNKLKRMLKK